MTGPTGHRVSSKSKLKTRGCDHRPILAQSGVASFAESAGRLRAALPGPPSWGRPSRATMGLEHPHKENIAMAADRFSVALAPVCLERAPQPPAASRSGGGAADHSQPFTIRDLVRLERISEIAASPDGKRVAYTLRSTDMEANKGRTGIWLVDTGTRTRAAPLHRLTDIAANSNSAEWSADGRYLYFLSNRSGTTQVWRVAAGGSGAGTADAPGADAMQVTNLPLDVGSFRVSPKGDRILVSVEVYLDCADLACTRQRLDAAAHSNAGGVLYDQLFVRHWDTWSDGRRSQLFAMALDDVARGTPVNLTGGIGDVPSKPFGGREDYAFSPDGTHVAFSVRAMAGEPWSTNFDIYEVAAGGRNAAQPDRGQSRLGRAACLLARRHAARLRGHGSAGLRIRPLSSRAAESQVRREAPAHPELGSIHREFCLVARRQEPVRHHRPPGPAAAVGRRCEDRQNLRHHRRRRGRRLQRRHAKGVLHLQQPGRPRRSVFGRIRRRRTEAAHPLERGGARAAQVRRIRAIQLRRLEQ